MTTTRSIDRPFAPRLVLALVVLALLAFVAHSSPALDPSASNGHPGGLPLSSAEVGRGASDVVTAADVYWLTRLDAICGLGVGLTIFGIGALVIAGLAYGDGVIRGWVVGLVCLVPMLGGAICVFVPTTKEAVAILVIPKIANNEDVQGLGADTVALAREWLQELRPASKKDGAK